MFVDPFPNAGCMEKQLPRMIQTHYAKPSIPDTIEISIHTT
jgi:hypothetical protein